MQDAISSRVCHKTFREFGVVLLAALFVLSLSDVHSPDWAVDEAAQPVAQSPCAQAAIEDAEIGPGCSSLTPDHPPALLQKSGSFWMLVRAGAPLALPQAVNWLHAIPASTTGVGCVSGPSPARAPPA